jgi:F-type H+-transporting ATPase subunit delta
MDTSAEASPGAGGPGEGPADPTAPGVRNPSNWTLAGVYAEALLGLYESDEQAEGAAEELAALCELMEQAEGFDRLLTSVSASRDKARAFVQRIFGGRVSPPVEGLLGVMALKGRLSLLRPVARRFRRMLNRREGKVDVLVTTAVPLDEEQRGRLRDVLRDMLNAEPLLTCRVQASVLGGAVIRVGDRLYDASVATQLERLRKQLAAGKPQWAGSES